MVAEACRMPQVVHQEMVQVHQGNHLVDQSDSGMGLPGHLDRRREDRHQAGFDHVGESSAVAAAAADAADPVKRHLDEAETAVPVARFRVSMYNFVGYVFKNVYELGLRRKATENIHMVLRSRWVNGFTSEKCYIIGPV